MAENGLWLLVLALGIALAISLFARVRSTRTAIDFQLAGRQVGVATNAFAICGDYVSAASFLGVGAAVYAVGLDGAWYATGFAAGFVPVLLFVAAPLRRFGERSIPDFLARRFESEAVRIVSVISVQLVILAYLVPQSVGGGLAWELYTDVTIPGLTPYTTGIVASNLITAVIVVVGGMRGTTWNQALQFAVLLGVLLWIAAALLRAGFSYSDAVQTANSQPLTSVVESDAGATTATTINLITGEPARFAEPGARYTLVGQFALLSTLVFGTMGLPHVMNRFFTSPTGRAARMTTVWVLGLVGLFYTLAVMAGTAARSIIADEAKTNDWLAGLTVDGVLKTPEHALLALGRIFGGNVGLSVVLTGALVAIMSTVGGLLLASSASLGHDVYEQYVNPRATRVQAMRAGQAAVLIVALGSAAIAVALDPSRISSSVPSIVASLVTAAFAVAGCTLTPAILLGIWWQRTTATGVVAGMIVGVISSIALIAIGLINSPSLGILQTPTFIVGPAVTGVMIVTSLVTAPVANVDRFWVIMHGSARDRQAERLTRVTLEAAQ